MLYREFLIIFRQHSNFWVIKKLTQRIEINMSDSKDLLQILWSGADVLCGKMDANEYKTYLLGMVF